MQIGKWGPEFEAVAKFCSKIIFKIISSDIWLNFGDFESKIKFLKIRKKFAHFGFYLENWVWAPPILLRILNVHKITQILSYPTWKSLGDEKKHHLIVYIGTNNTRNLIILQKHANWKMGARIRGSGQILFQNNF